MAETITCDVCETTVRKGQARHWLSIVRTVDPGVEVVIRRSYVESIAPRGDFCSAACLAKRANQYAEAIERHEQRAG